MRDGQARLVDRLVAVEQQVEVDRPRPPALAALAAELALDREQPVEQLARRELGLERGGAVQEARLVGEPTGSVSRSAETATTPGQSARRAARIVASRSPRLAPRPT